MPQSGKMSQIRIREKHHRLSRNFYKGNIICAFTFCTASKANLFIETKLFNVFVQILLDSLKQNNCQAFVYLFMPDHCHFLIGGKSEVADLWKTVVTFKQKSGYWVAKNKYDVKWQKDFYDHILRKDADVIKQIKYILNNPVRKGLVDNWKNYSFKGSTVYNLDEWK